MNTVNLKKGVYESARVSALRNSLLDDDILTKLQSMQFNEILKYLEEHGFKKAIDTSFLDFEGFYLIEKILNDYLCEIYTKVFSFSKGSSKKLLETFYLKYQIHNMLSVVRCMVSKETEITPFLIGEKRRKEKYVKALEMSSSDALSYLSKKLGFDEQNVLENFNKGVFELENYLYGEYYSRLVKSSFKFNNSDEKIFFKYVREYIDALNSRLYVKLNVENKKELFDSLFIEGGYVQRKFYDGSFDEFRIKCSSEFKVEFENPADFDKFVNKVKSSGENRLKSVRFGSPFHLMHFLFDVEVFISKLRVLLKAKYLNLSDEDLKGLLE